MKQFIVAAMLMAAGHCYANSPALYECIYSYRAAINDAEKPSSEESECILQIGDDKSRFYDYVAFRLDSVSAIPGISNEVKEEFNTAYLKADQYFEQTVITDLSDNELTVYCDMAPDHYRYVQKLPLIDWKLSDDTDTICGYLCHKATGVYGGREWTVWYADEIPAPFGPWKLSGLPGLVLKAIDSEEIHDFEAISFRNGSSEISEPKVPNVNSIKAEKFIERKNSFDKDPMGSIERESITSLTVLPNRSLLVNGVRIRNHKSGFQPLEYSESEIKKGVKTKQTKEPQTQEEIKVIGVGTMRK